MILATGEIFPIMTGGLGSSGFKKKKKTVITLTFCFKLLFSTCSKNKCFKLSSGQKDVSQAPVSSVALFYPKRKTHNPVRRCRDETVVYVVNIYTNASH